MKKPFRPRMENLEDRRTPGETFESILPLLTAGPLALPLILSEQGSDHLFQPDHRPDWGHQLGDDPSMEAPNLGADDLLANSREANSRNAQDSGYSATVSIVDGGSGGSRFNSGLADDLDWLTVRVGGRVDFTSSDGAAITGSAGPATLDASIGGSLVGDGFIRPTAPFVVPTSVSESMSHPGAAGGVQAAVVIAAASAEPVDLGGGVDTSPKEYVTLTNMTATDDLYWFNGATPANYSTTITLSVENPGSYYGYQWKIASGTEMVDFAGYPGQDTVSQGYGGNPSLSVVSIAPSESLNDVTIEVRGYINPQGFTTAAPIAGVAMSVLVPHHLAHLGNEDKADATFGFVSTIKYQIENQFSKVLPRRVPINEKWTGPQIADFAGTDWTRPEAKGHPGVNPANWADKISGMPGGKVPVPQAPGKVLGNNKVDHWPGEWYVGSEEVGKGVRVQTNTWQSYDDHGRHEGIVSPS